MRSIYIAIPDDAADKLRELARREFRAPRQQAAILVLEGLKNAGLDPDVAPENPAESSDVPPGSSQLASGAGVRAGQGAHGRNDLPIDA